MSLLVGVVESVAPTAEPVTVPEAKEHLGILPADTVHDDKLARMIATARLTVESRQGRQIVTATYVATYSDFPRGGRTWFEIPRPPLQSVSSVQYYDENGTQQTWTSSEYIVDTVSEPGRIALDPDFNWPNTESGRINRVDVTFVAGYGAPTAVPETIKEQVLHWINMLFEDRGGEGDKLSMEVADALHYATWPGVYR
jgi:uncharacterized phiE125 gp8 family phage protein